MPLAGAAIGLMTRCTPAGHHGRVGVVAPRAYPATKGDGMSAPSRRRTVLTSLEKQVLVSWFGGPHSHAIGQNMAQAFLRMVKDDAHDFPHPNDRENITVCNGWRIRLEDPRVRSRDAPPTCGRRRGRRPRGFDYAANWNLVSGPRMNKRRYLKHYERGVYPIARGNMTFASNMTEGAPHRSHRRRFLESIARPAEGRVARGGSRRVRGPGRHLDRGRRGLPVALISNRVVRRRRPHGPAA
jgi:hypothetical protein